MPESTPTLVLLAAGLGTRYGGLKQIEPVGPAGEAVLDYTLAEAAAAGFRRAVVVVRPEIEEEVRRHLDRSGAGGLETTLVHQTLASAVPGGLGSGDVRASRRGRPWGTAHAVLAASAELRGPFAVANADDLYGKDAWTCLADWFGGGEDGAEAAVVGYRLTDTLSPHGGVSRAVLDAGEDGLLRSVREVTDVRLGPGGAITGVLDGGRRSLDGEARVSMNLWGFGPGLVPLLADAFRRFLAAGPGPTEELQLPEVIGEAVTRGRLGVRLLPCGRDWLGMTHPEDRGTMARRLARRGPPAGAPEAGRASDHEPLAPSSPPA